MRASIRFLFSAFCVLAFATQAQVRAPGTREFQITKITRNLITTPDYGIGQYRPAGNERWLSPRAW